MLLFSSCGWRHHYEVGSHDSRPIGGGWGWSYNPMADYTFEYIRGQELYDSALFLPLMKSDAVFVCTILSLKDSDISTSTYNIHIDDVWFGQAPEGKTATLIIPGKSTLDDMEQYWKKWDFWDSPDLSNDNMIAEQPQGYPQPHINDRLILFATYSEKYDRYSQAAHELSIFVINPPDDTLFPFCCIDGYLEWEGKQPKDMREHLEELLEIAPNLTEPSVSFGKIGEKCVGIYEKE